MQSLECSALVLVLQLQQYGWVFGLYHIAHVLPVCVQHVFPDLHPLIAEHEAFPNQLFLPHLQLERCQLIILVFLHLLDD